MSKLKLFHEIVLVSQSCPTLVTAWIIAHQASLSLGFSRKEFWSE